MRVFAGEQFRKQVDCARSRRSKKAGPTVSRECPSYGTVHPAALDTRVSAKRKTVRRKARLESREITVRGSFARRVVALERREKETARVTTGLVAFYRSRFYDRRSRLRATRRRFAEKKEDAVCVRSRDKRARDPTGPRSRGTALSRARPLAAIHTSSSRFFRYNSSGRRVGLESRRMHTGSCLTASCACCVSLSLSLASCTSRLPRARDYKKVAESHEERAAAGVAYSYSHGSPQRATAELSGASVRGGRACLAYLFETKTTLR